MEDPDEPTFDFLRTDANITRCVVDFRSVLRPFSGRRGDHAAVWTVGFILAIDGLPQRNKGQEDRLAAACIGCFIEQVESGNAVDLATLEAEVVPYLDEAGDQSGFEVGIVNVVTGCMPTLGPLLASLFTAGEGLHLLPHGRDGSGVAFGEPGGRELLG